jgi:hypothetical protein
MAQLERKPGEPSPQFLAKYKKTPISESDGEKKKFLSDFKLAGAYRRHTIDQYEENVSLKNEAAYEDANEVFHNMSTYGLQKNYINQKDVDKALFPYKFMIDLSPNFKHNKSLDPVDLSDVDLSDPDSWPKVPMRGRDDYISQLQLAEAYVRYRNAKFMQDQDNAIEGKKYTDALDELKRLCDIGVQKGFITEAEKTKLMYTLSQKDAFMQDISNGLDITSDLYNSLKAGSLFRSGSKSSSKSGSPHSSPKLKDFSPKDMKSSPQLFPHSPGFPGGDEAPATNHEAPGGWWHEPLIPLSPEKPPGSSLPPSSSAGSSSSSPKSPQVDGKPMKYRQTTRLPVVRKNKNPKFMTDAEKERIDYQRKAIRVAPPNIKVNPKDDKSLCRKKDGQAFQVRSCGRPKGVKNPQEPVRKEREINDWERNYVRKFVEKRMTQKQRLFHRAVAYLYRQRNKEGGVTLEELARNICVEPLDGGDWKYDIKTMHQYRRKSTINLPMYITRVRYRGLQTTTNRTNEKYYRQPILFDAPREGVWALNPRFVSVIAVLGLSDMFTEKCNALVDNLDRCGPEGFRYN